MINSERIEADEAAAKSRDEQAAVVLALPTLAQAAFGVIVVAFVGIAAAALIGDAPLRMEPIILSLFLLPARAVLGRPEQARRLEEDAAATRRLAASGELGRVERAVTELAQAAYGLPPVGVLILRQPIGAYMIGSWRRNYLALGHKTAARIAAGLAAPEPPEWVRALLLHELSHVAARDPQRVGFAGELLRGAFTVLPWWILFLCFWIGMALQGLDAALSFDFAAVPGIPLQLSEAANGLIALDPATRAEYAQRAADTNFPSLVIFVVLSLWPIALVAGILYAVFWRWMLRLQEHYADLQARQQGVTAASLTAARGWVYPWTVGRARLWSRAARWVPDRLASLMPRLAERVRQWFRSHPTPQERAAILESPQRLYDDWQRVAWSTAILSLGLDVIFASPLFLYHNYLVHLYPLTGLVLLSTWLLPQLVLKNPIGRPLRQVLLLIVAVRAAWLALNMLLLVVPMFLFPAAALELLNVIVIAGSRFVGRLAEAPVTDPMMGLAAMAGAVGVEVLELAGLVVALAIYIAVQRRAPDLAARRHWALVAAIGVAVLALVMVVAQWLNW